MPPTTPRFFADLPPGNDRCPFPVVSPLRLLFGLRSVRTALGLLLVACGSLSLPPVPGSPESASAGVQSGDGSNPPSQSPSHGANLPPGRPGHEPPEPVPDSIDRLLSQIYPLASIIQHGCRPTTEPSTQEYAVFLATPELDFPVRVVCLLSTDGKSVSGWDEMAGDRLLMRWHGGMQVPPMLLGKLVSLGFSPPEQVAPGLWMALHPQPHLWLVPDALEAVQGLPALAYAEPDGIVRVHHLPDDPAFVEGALWNLLNDGREGGIDGFDVAALAGWAITTDARHAPIAIVDSGIRYTHRDLAANMWVNPGEIRDGRDSDNNLYVDDIHGINRVTSLPSRRGDPADDFGHGTHVAGIAAAVGGNRLDGVGVAWSARLMALKSLSAAGTGTVSGSVACLDYARTHGAAVINLSWGRDAFSQALFDAVAACRESGIPVVAAAGNNGRNLDLSPHYPASFELDNVIVVGAFDRRGQWLRESNFG